MPTVHRERGARHHHHWLGAVHRAVAVMAAMFLIAELAVVAASTVRPGQAQAATAPPGAGFTLNASDLKFILKQIKIAEHHAITESGPGAPLVGPGEFQIANPMLPHGLRTVDGSENNLQPGQNTFGAVDQKFPRLTDPVFRDAEDSDGTFGASRADVLQAEDGQRHRLAAARDQQPDRRPDRDEPGGDRGGRQSRTARQGDAGASRAPAGPRTDPRGLHARARDAVHPERDHRRRPVAAVQLVVHPLRPVLRPRPRPGRTRAAGTVFMPLKADDPLIAGPDHIAGNADDLPASRRFMVLTRAQNQPGPDGVLGNADDDAGRDQHRHAVGRPEPDLHVALLAPGLPARVRQQRGRPARADGKMLRAAARRRHGHLGAGQVAGRDAARLPLEDTDVAQRPAGRHRPVRQLPARARTGSRSSSPPPASSRATRPPRWPSRPTRSGSTRVPRRHRPPRGADGRPRRPRRRPREARHGHRSGDRRDGIRTTYDDEMLDTHFVAGDGRVTRTSR